MMGLFLRKYDALENMFSHNGQCINKTKRYSIKFRKIIVNILNYTNTYDCSLQIHVGRKKYV